MAATVTIRRWTGASGSPTKTDITGIATRANAEDAHSVSGSSNSILIPESGSNYSYWVTTRLSVDAISDGEVNNFKWFTDGTNSFGTGVTCVVATADSYVQATGTEGETGTELTTGNHAGLAGAPSDAFAYDSSDPLEVAGDADSTGDAGDFVVYQTVIASTAAQGATGSETFTWQYDDTSS